jgi:hypothetical protein
VLNDNLARGRATHRVAINVMLAVMERPLGFGQTETIAILLKGSKRHTSSVPIRRSFVQGGTQALPVPGPLQRLVSNRDEAGLDLFLLHRAVVSKEPWGAVKDAAVWGRAIGLGRQNESVDTAQVSRVFRRLDQQLHLITREPLKRQLNVVALKEDGSGDPYDSPSASYFRLPFAYWTDDWYRRLSLAARGCLLIAMSLTPPFILPLSQVKKWYGISPETASKGLAELSDAGLLKVKTVRRRDWASASTWRTERTYELLPPFDRKLRLASKSGATKRSVKTATGKAAKRSRRPAIGKPTTKK